MNLKFGLTRDSALWYVGMFAAVVLGLASLTTGTECPTSLGCYGISDKAAPYLRLGALLIGTVSGWMKTSPRPHSEMGDAKITPDDRK